MVLHVGDYGSRGQQVVGGAHGDNSLDRWADVLPCQGMTICFVCRTMLNPAHNPRLDEKRGDSCPRPRGRLVHASHPCSCGIRERSPRQRPFRRGFLTTWYLGRALLASRLVEWLCNKLLREPNNRVMVWLQAETLRTLGFARVWTAGCSRRWHRASRATDQTGKARNGVEPSYPRATVHVS